MTLIIAFAASFLLALVVTPIVRATSLRTGIFLGPRDRPSPSIPRCGGVAVFLAWAFVLLLVPDERIAGGLVTLPSRSVLVAAAALVFAAGLLDDMRPLPPWMKLIAEASGAAVLMASGLTIEHITFSGHTIALGWIGPIVTMGWFLLLINAFNLMDGLDGLTAGLALIAGTACAGIALLRGDMATALVLLPLLGALAGLLPFNFNPAAVFLGDGGSLLIGVVLAATSISGLQKGATVLATGVPLLIFALPILETGLTIVRRTTSGFASQPSGGYRVIGRIFQPDREHIHHRLLRAGLGHRGTVLLLYAASVAFAGLAFLAAQF